VNVFGALCWAHGTDEWVLVCLSFATFTLVVFFIIIKVPFHQIVLQCKTITINYRFIALHFLVFTDPQPKNTSMCEKKQNSGRVGFRSKSIERSRINIFRVRRHAFARSSTFRFFKRAATPISVPAPVPRNDKLMFVQASGDWILNLARYARRTL